MTEFRSLFFVMDAVENSWSNKKLKHMVQTLLMLDSCLYPAAIPGRSFSITKPQFVGAAWPKPISERSSSSSFSAKYIKASFSTLLEQDLCHTQQNDNMGLSWKSNMMAAALVIPLINEQQTFRGVVCVLCCAACYKKGLSNASSVDCNDSKRSNAKPETDNA